MGLAHFCEILNIWIAPKMAKNGCFWPIMRKNCGPVAPSVKSDFTGMVAIFVPFVTTDYVRAF